MNSKVLLLFCLLAAIVLAVWGSSHGEAPGTAKAPSTDITDLFAFNSYETGRTGYVTLILGTHGLEDGFAAPNWFALNPRATYEINIDNTGDGIADLSYQFIPTNELGNNGTGVSLKIDNQDVAIALKVFGPVTVSSNAGLNFFEYYRLNLVTKNGTSAVKQAGSGATTFVKPFDNVGTKAMSDYEAYAQQYIYSITIPGCSSPGKVFVGQRRDPFVIQIGPIFDLVNFVPVDAASGFPGGITQNKTKNQLKYKNISGFHLEIPKVCLVGKTSTIGVYGSVSFAKKGRQLNGMGNPLVNELLIGLPDKDYWNQVTPDKDSTFLKYFQYPTLPAIIDLLFRSAVNSALGLNLTNLAPTNFPRNDLVAILLTGIPGVNQISNTSTGYFDLLRLNTDIPATAPASQKTLGLIVGDNAGYPNGRRPVDDVIDISLRAVMGVVCYLNLGVCTPSQAPVGNAALTDGAPSDINDYTNAFPYLATPINGDLIY